ncbi:alpha/beta hydrolase fold domain-containing protein [Periconia macrospinosa]|uniref:Alpha/beta hydrolase fold domain-containing protein n=1 Tax=Periconia macrospinosa TaxID=97972 RepID=A0A2V1DME1_9PLEO|nr:alpha/beta hydrolase fold domain-containing protein [Periconia macrospinosa]
MRENEELKVGHGRVLSYAIYGSPVPKTTVFYFHDFLSCGKEGKIWHTASSKLHVRLVSASRPGMGDSTYNPDRSLLDWPKDVLALADHLKVQRFYVVGLGSGGPYVLACVRNIPKERLAGVAVVSSLYPVSTETVHMPFFPRFLTTWIGPYVPGSLDLFIDMTMGKAARDPDPKVFDDWLIKEVESRRPKVDQDVIINEQNRWMFLSAARDSLKQGSQGLAWETRLVRAPWEFELQELKVGDEGIPLTLWHGSEDTNCPLEMVEKAKEFMPESRLCVKQDEGHFSLAFGNQEEILGDLIGVEWL